jgi:hypothetical protein
VAEELVMLKQTCISVVAVFLLLPVAAFADGTVSLTLSSSSNGQTVSPGASIQWTVTATVSTGDNQGLALISVDLLQDDANPELLDLPQADSPPTEMLGFARPGGITNPAGYGGTHVGTPGELDLAQIGGGQNTFGEAGPPGVGQDVDVDTGVGQGLSGQVICTGSFNAPSAEGTYHFFIDNAVANVLETVQTRPLPSPVAPATVVIDVGTISFTVEETQCCSCFGDIALLGGGGCNDVRNVVDFTRLAASLYAVEGDPNYNICADLNGNGVVNVADFTLFTTVYNVPCP